ncbi:MAG TPA: phenylalanine--tRNA ligase beta subunit-related protein [Anaerolineales bacterium]|nr:phenylalanine--tRNA ligase beta subunit-related protein [Anaerolineales bacterium]HLE04373.1 phenylalanine--tRNA ligase beta subunit-related protein [Anaerolineales bacterium]
MLVASDRWKAAYPGASVGVLAMSGVANPERSPELEARKEALEVELRSRFASFDRHQLKVDPLLAPYTGYYKRFGKTYHVQHQLESVVFHGQSISSVAALVEAMFMAELKNFLLTAGHDLDSVRGEMGVDVATGAETYLRLTGQQRALKQGDMFIHDEVGVLSSIIYGPDHRTRITPTTKHVLFTVYAPAGISEEKVRDHLSNLEDFVLAVSPAAEVEHAEVIDAGSGS